MKVFSLLGKPQPTTGLDFSIGRAEKHNKSALPAPDNIRTYVPDGHLSSVEVDENGNTKFVSFWSHATNFRTVGPVPLSHDDGGQTVTFLDFDYTSEQRCSGGLWLMAVLDLGSDNWVGFYHAEDIWTHLPNPERKAWKSIAVSKSTDKGLTWTVPRQIIEAQQPQPDEPEFGGAGYCHAVYDSDNGRIVLHFQEKNSWNAAISVAMTTDLDGLENWMKYDGTDFRSDGMGGEVFHLENIKLQPGLNPSVQWNEFLSKWIMVWHGWDPGNIYLSSSEDMVTWDEPQLLVEPKIRGENSKVWYPTLLDPMNGDTPGLQELDLYCAEMASFPRDMMVRRITFSPRDKPKGKPDK